MTTVRADCGNDVAAAVWAALAEVRDPELDEPVTDLEFVAFAQVHDGVASIRLRLPTYFCAANFAFLMVADAHAAVSAVEGVDSVEVTLDDHFAAGPINTGVAAGDGFVATFPGLAQDELDELRAQFLRKAVLAATDRICRPLLDAGARPTDLAAMTLADVPRSAEEERLRSRRAQLRLPAADSSPLLLDPLTGAAVDAGAAAGHLDRARLTRVSIEANGELCRGLLRQRQRETPVELTGNR